MKEVKPNSPALFQKTKEWIATGQKVNVDKHLATAEAGQSPLNILVEDIKAHTPKYVRRLTVSGVAAIAAGLSFGCNINSSNPGRSESANVLAVEQVKTDPMFKSTDSVFQLGGKRISMSRGGTAIAIKHALQNHFTMSSMQVQNVFVEAAQINNGRVNSVNPKEVATKMSYYNNYVRQGMTQSEALVMATVTWHSKHPELFKTNFKDTQAFEELAKESGIELGSRTDRVTKAINELQQQNQIPTIASSTLPLPELSPLSPERPPSGNLNESKQSFEQWVKDNQKSIDDFLKATGMLTIAGLATAAGLATTQQIYRKYQLWEVTLPPMTTKAEVKAHFWTNMEKYKRSELAQKLKIQAKTAQTATQRLVTPETPSLQSQPLETDANPSELQPGVGECWYSFVRGFRKKFVRLLAFTKGRVQSEVHSVKQLIAGVSSNTTTKVQENLDGVKSTVRGVRDTTLQKTETQKANTETKKANRQAQREQAQKVEAAQKQEHEKNQVTNELQKQRVQTIAKMENFEIPFVPYKQHQDSENYLNRFVITKEMTTRAAVLQFTNADLEAINILQTYNQEIVASNSRFREQAQKALDFLHDNEHKQIDKLRLKEFIVKEGQLSGQETLLLTKVLDFNFANIGSNLLLKVFEAKRRHVTKSGGNKQRLLNALETCVNFYEEIDAELGPMRQILATRQTMAKPGETANVNGKAEEMRESFCSWATGFIGQSHRISDIPLEARYNLDMLTLKNKIHFALFNYKPSSWIGQYAVEDLKDFDQIDFANVKLLLNDFQRLVKDYKINTQKPSDALITKKYVDLQGFNGLLANVELVVDKMKLPADEPGYSKDYCEYDQESNQFSCDGETVWIDYTLQYPQSRLFPGVLDRKREYSHIIEIAKSNRICLETVRQVLQNEIPSNVTEKQRKWYIDQYQTAIKVFNLKSNKYRYNRTSEPTYDSSPASILVDPLLITAFSQTPK
jgi:hypothetical protein